MSEAHKLGVVTPCRVTQSTKGVVRETHNLLFFFVLQINIMNIADYFNIFCRISKRYCELRLTSHV